MPELFKAKIGYILAVMWLFYALALSAVCIIRLRSDNRQ